VQPWVSFNDPVPNPRTALEAAVHHGAFGACVDVAGSPGNILLAAEAVLRWFGFVDASAFQELLAPRLAAFLRRGFLQRLRDDFVHKRQLFLCAFGETFAG
jgi:hypothetical protein